jgi:outer membrane protein insertion porin family
VVAEARPREDDLAVVLRISEGDRRTVGQVVVEGNRRTRESLLKDRVRLGPGDPLDPRQLARAERDLLALGVFRAASIGFSPENPSRVKVAVEEEGPYRLGYDLRYDDEDGWSALVEGEAGNLFGRAVALGGRYRAGSRLNEARAYLSLPAFTRRGGLLLAGFRMNEEFTSDDTSITRESTGAELQQHFLLGRYTNLFTGYSFRRAIVRSPFLPEIPEDTASLDLSVVRETRDRPLDARAGRLLSANLSYAPAFLGSDFPFVKTFAQGFFARTFEDRLTWAQGVRLGLAWGLDGEPLIPFERFRAGGPNSLRGFGTDTVGPRTPLGDPAGGQATVVFNEELRLHGPSGISGAVFWDFGNVFRTVADMRLDLRHTLGAGLRWASPVGLLRFDLGLPLQRQEGEKRVRFWFSFGQAF